MKQIKCYHPEIPGLAATESRDFEIGKTSGIPRLGIPNRGRLVGEGHGPRLRKATIR